MPIKEAHTPWAEGYCVGIDPGATSGIAVLDATGVLCLVIAGTPEEIRDYYRRMPVPHYRTVRGVVVEIPQVYRRDPTKASALITTAYRAGQLVMLVDHRHGGDWMAPVISKVLPRQWKGQVPKAIHNARVKAALTPPERALLDAAKFTKGQMDDVLDAIGLAKWGFKNRKKAWERT